MPVSDAEGKDWIVGTLDDLGVLQSIYTVYDLGAGAGTYADLFRDRDHNLWYSATWVGVEIFEPYIKQYHLNEKYDRVIPGDIMDLEYPKLREDGMVIVGDVLEHLVEDEAHILMEYLKDRFAVIVLSLPIVHSPQGEVNGNIHETHHKDWSFTEAKELMDGTRYDFKGHTIGAFIWLRSEHR